MSPDEITHNYEIDKERFGLYMNAMEKATNTRDCIVDRIKKMQKLVSRGTAGESFTAKTLIEKLARKYDIDLSAICSESRKFYIKASGWRLSLIMQLCAVICGVDGFQATKVGKGVCCIECEEAQWLEVISRFKVLEKDYKEQLSLFYEAFIVCNGLTLKSGNQMPDQTDDVDKARKVKKMASGLFKSKQPAKGNGKKDEIKMICQEEL